MDSCRDCGLELVGDELLSLDNKCAKCTEFKTLWMCTSFEEALRGEIVADLLPLPSSTPLMLPSTPPHSTSLMLPSTPPHSTPLMLPSIPPPSSPPAFPSLTTVTMRKLPEISPKVVFHRTLSGSLNLPPPPPPERFYQEEQITRLERGTLDVDSPRTMYWADYHIQWSFLQQPSTARKFEELKVLFFVKIRGARQRQEVMEALEDIKNATEEMSSDRTKKLKKYIKNTCPPGYGEGSRHRVDRANVKFVLALRKGMHENWEEVKLYNRPTVERLGQFLLTLRNIWIPSYMRSRRCSI